MRPARIRERAAQLGVPEAQVRRDILISHVLHALPQIVSRDAQVIFFGGTALCRTHLDGFRLSEDIDLLTDRPRELLDRLGAGLPVILRRDYPMLRLTIRPDGQTIVADLTDGVDLVQLQAVKIDHSYRQYPSEPTDVALHNDDLPATVVLTAPTAAGAAAMKLNAWADRRLPRDLADLYGLYQRGLIDREAIEIAGRAAPALPPHAFEDEAEPDAQTWMTALAAQMREPPAPRPAFLAVRAAVAQLRGWPQARAWSRQAAAPEPTGTPETHIRDPIAPWPEQRPPRGG